MPRLGHEYAPVRVAVPLPSGVVAIKWRVTRDYPSAVYAACLRLGLQHLNDEHDAGRPVPSDHDLADWLEELIWDRAYVEVLEPGETQPSRRNRRGLQLRDPERISLAAAARVLEWWTPTYMEQVRERAARGGRNSKRKPRFTLAMFATVLDLSKPEQAERLGCSLPTVKRLRRVWAAATAEQRSEAIAADGRPSRPETKTEPQPEPSEPVAQAETEDDPAFLWCHWPRVPHHGRDYYEVNGIDVRTLPYPVQRVLHMDDDDIAELLGIEPST